MNEQLITRIKGEYHTFSKTNRMIANVIFSEEIHFGLTISELARQSYCSPSAIIKFIKLIGFDSYKVFKNHLNSTSNFDDLTIVGSIFLVDNYIRENNILVTQFIEDIKKSKRVYFFAMGTSKLSVNDFIAKTNNFNDKKYIFTENKDANEALINTINEDVIIFVSNSGDAKELVYYSKLLQDQNTYLVTNRETSQLSRKIKNTINLGNHYETKFDFENRPRESKYSILYFMDKIFEMIYIND